MLKDWIKIYSSDQMYKAEFIKTFLEANDIECVILNKQDSSYNIGEVELYVQYQNILKAKQIISENEIE